MNYTDDKDYYAGATPDIIDFPCSQSFREFYQETIFGDYSHYNKPQIVTEEIHHIYNPNEELKSIKGSMVRFNAELQEHFKSHSIRKRKPEHIITRIEE